MKRDDDLFDLASGELESDKADGLMARLDSDERRELEAMQQMFADLRALRESTPPCQLSFESIRDRIEGASAVSSGRVVRPIWWRWAPTALAAGVAMVFAIQWQSGGFAIPSAQNSAIRGDMTMQAAAMPERSKASAPSAESAPAPAMAMAAPESTSGAAGANVTAEQASRDAEVLGRVAPRRASTRRTLVASMQGRGRGVTLTRQAQVPPSVSAAASPELPGSTVAAAADAATVSTMQAPEVDGDLASRSRGADEDAGGSVVVVTGQQDPTTGAQAAVEIQRSNDVVLGG